MGTRHLTVVVHEGKHKVAQYGQWDGYPSGQGLTVLRFARGQLSDFQAFEDFVKRLKLCRFVDQKELKKLWVEAGADPGSEFVSMDVSDKFKRMYPTLHRNCGADVLHHILIADVSAHTGETIPLDDSYEFAADSLFCEWAYVLDLDTNRFEVYKGFNKKEPVGRFANLKGEKDSAYRPVSLSKYFDLGALPGDEEFLKLFKEDSDED